MDHDPAPGAPRTPDLAPPAPAVAKAINTYADRAARARAIRFLEEEHEFDSLVAAGSTAEEARAVITRRRVESLAQQVEAAKGVAALSADEAYDRLMGRPPRMVTTHTLRDPDNRDDDGAPYEFTGDAERVATYLDMLAERDMRSAEGRAAVTALAAAIRHEGTVSPGHAESIRQAAGVYVTAAAAEPTVRVRVSLLRDSADTLDRAGYHGTADALRDAITEATS